MFKIFLSAMTFVGLVALVVVVIKKVPQVQIYADCYGETHAIYTEKYIVSRRAYTKDENICIKNKQLVLRGAECFYREESRMEALDSEKDILRSVAKAVTRASKELDEVVADHNSKCAAHESSMIDEYELRELELKYTF